MTVITGVTNYLLFGGILRALTSRGPQPPLVIELVEMTDIAEIVNYLLAVVSRASTTIGY